MSSEETLSVGGSKEVRALQYGNEGMESGSFGSKRTEDEVSGKEIIEGGEEGVPSNILEIKGKGDRCYNVEADIVSEGKGYETELVKAESRKVKGWYYFTPRSSNKEKMNLFSVGPSSIKGWKEKFLFVDDTEWERRDAEVEFLSSWKAKKANQNKYSLNSDKEEEVKKLVREGGDILDVMYLTSSNVIDAAKLNGPTRGLAIPKKPRKKLKTSDVAKVRGDEVAEFIPRPPLVELNLELKEIRVSTHGKGKALVPHPTLYNSIFDMKSSMAVKNFLNAYLHKVDCRQAREEVLSNGGSSVVKHALEVRRLMIFDI
ncbi:hypothetical protein SLEP1_g22323 [Rubroshorea leprosula]|uniref:Uncharacterized protein n=1 Tax=Rubroshorea leprosula TaxID=152421 RepID=A0AAV5JKU6_9ROSI|nr:hypothetical protein SLEP1_g22323 [Rubroshorea leprosula]